MASAGPRCFPIARSLFFLLSLLCVVVFSGSSQNASTAPNKEVIAQDDRIIVEVSRQPCDTKTEQTDGGAAACIELAITNLSSEPITAWAVELERTSPRTGKLTSRSVRCEDSILIPRQPELKPRDTHRVPMGTPGHVIFKAAIFADGSVSGDPVWIARIIGKRKQLYDDDMAAAKALRAELAANTPVAQVALEFDEMARQRSSAAFPPSYPVFPGRSVFRDVSANLVRNGSDDSRSALDAELTSLTNQAARVLTSKPPIGQHAASKAESQKR
jgi:hypothetical protein